MRVEWLRAFRLFVGPHLALGLVTVFPFFSVLYDGFASDAMRHNFSGLRDLLTGLPLERIVPFTVVLGAAVLGRIELHGFARVLSWMGRRFGHSSTPLQCLTVSVIGWWPQVPFLILTWGVQLSTGSLFLVVPGLLGVLGSPLDLCMFAAWLLGLYMQLYAVGNVFSVSSGRALLILALARCVWFLAFAALSVAMFLAASVVLRPWY